MVIFLIKTSRWIYVCPNCSALLFVSFWVSELLLSGEDKQMGRLHWQYWCQWLSLVICTKAESGSFKVRLSRYCVVWGVFRLWVFFPFSPFSSLIRGTKQCVWYPVCSNPFLCCFQGAITVIGLWPTRITASSCSVTSWACARMLENKTSKTCLQVKPCFRLLGNPGSWFFLL